MYIFFIPIFLSKNVGIFVLSSEQTLNQKKPGKTRRRNKVYPNKENNKKSEKQQILQKEKFPDPIIYDPDRNQRNILLADDNNHFKHDKEQTNSDAMKITNYYLELHKEMINTYNSVYSQILQNISNVSWDGLTIPVRFANYPFDINNIYSSLTTSTTDKSLKLADSIITENLDTFMKSIELTQRFYKDLIESYMNCMKQS